MEMIYTNASYILILVLAFAVIASMFMASYSFYRRNVPGAIELAILLLCVSIFCLGSMGEILAESLNTTLLMVRIHYFFGVLTAPTYFLVILHLNNKKPLPIWLYVAVYIPGLITFIDGYILGNFHHIYKNFELVEGKYYPILIFEQGILANVGFIYVVSITLIAEVILVYLVFKSSGKKRLQNILFLVGGLIGTFNAIFYLDRRQMGFDSQPFALIILGIFIYTAIFYANALDFVKVARENAVDSFEDYLLIMDNDKVVLDINASGLSSKLLRHLKANSLLSKETEIEQILHQYLNAFERDENTIHFEYSNDEQHFHIDISKVFYGHNKRESGYAVIFHEITETVHLMKQLEHLALTDPLTGVSNRAHWMGLAEREMDISSRSGAPFVVMMLDIDQFKKVNDTYGHQFGDQILVEFCQIVLNTIRSYDIFARYGGEEFCLLCVNTDLTTGLIIADRIRENVEKHFFSFEDKEVDLTVSIGVYQGEKGEKDKISTYLNEADKALYIAKTSGRNRVIN